MSASAVQVAPLRASDLPEANRVVRLAFGTFLGLPDPMAFMGDRDFLTPRVCAPHVRTLAARIDGRLIGFNVLTRWGSFAFFGPLVVLPEFWNQRIAQRLLDPMVRRFDRWKLPCSGLFTFPHSAKHVGLYQKFGYWPHSLSAVMTLQPDSAPASAAPTLLSALPRARRNQAIAGCARLTGQIYRGLDLTAEIRSILARKTGDIVLIFTRGVLDGFALCLTGAGTEGGSETVYVKFAAARGGSGAPTRFDRLLDGCAAFASSRGLPLEAGVSFACPGAYQRMRDRGFRAAMQGVSMLRPNAPGLNRPDTWLLGDWR